MPISERDYMKGSPGGEGSPTRVRFQKGGRTILFRILIVLWLSYLTIKTHDFGGVRDRVDRIGTALWEATSEFFQSVKDAVTETSREEVDVIPEEE